MHDPMTVICDVNLPWGKHNTLLTLWHKDPEKRGDDDSCNWFGGNLTSEECAWIEKEANSEWDFVFGKHGDMRNAPASEVIYGLWSMIAWRRYRRRMAPKDLFAVVELAGNPNDNLQNLVRRAINGKEEFQELFRVVFRCYKRHSRPWWKHPRFHFWHWKFQIHPWQQFRRWLLTRCATCGGSFRYGESPIAMGWHTPKPQWFRGEVGLHHQKCVHAEEVSNGSI